MTQAFNLSQLANKVNTSGQLDGATGLTGTITSSALSITGNSNLATSSGSVGIGTTTPGYKLSVNSSNGINSYDGVAGKGRFVLGDPADPNGYVGMYRSAIANIGTAGNEITIASFSGIGFTTGGTTFSTQTERMRIDSSGAVNINRTSGGGKLNVTGDLWLYATTAGAGNSTLKYNSGTGQVTYDASSRYYKENIQDLEYGLSSVMAMKPRKYVYKATGVIDIGFIADEMLPLVPEITPLANNSINDMGVPDGEPFTVNYDRLTAVLVKAIQEQQTIINDLKARVEILELK